MVGEDEPGSQADGSMMEGLSASSDIKDELLAQSMDGQIPNVGPAGGMPQKMSLIDSCSGVGSSPEMKVPSGSGPGHVPRADSVPPLHPLHQTSPGGPGDNLGPGVLNANGGPNGVNGENVPGAVGSVSEFELARRLGVRFDSSNAAWVARWTDTQNDRKKSRWFSIAKYGNSSARRLAIQACLHNMKPTDYPSLRDLQDVLTSFHSPGGGAGGGAPGYLVPGDVGPGGSPNMGAGMRPGLDGHQLAGMAGKLGPQFGHAPHMMHPNAFAMSGLTNPAMAGYMAGMPGGMGMHPGAPLGMYCQGVPQHQATQSMAPAEGPEDEQGLDSEEGVPPGMKYEGPEGGEQNIVVKPPPYDQTTTAASSVDSPSGGLKMPGVMPQGVGTSDPAFLQSLSANALPTTPPESASSSSSRFILSGGSPSSQDTSDLDARSGSEDEDEDEDDEGKEDGERGSKRKKRKLEEQAAVAAAQGAMQAGQVPGQYGMNLYNPAAQAGLNAMAAAAAGHLHPSYYSLYQGFQHPHAQQMLMHQMNGAAGGQPGLHGMPFFLQPSMLPMLHPHFQHQAAAAGFLPQHLQATSPNGDSGGQGCKRHHGHSGSQSSSSSGGAGGGGGGSSAKMTCERGLHYTKNYQGNQECWIAVWNTKGGRIMHEAFDVAELGYEGAKQKAREARDAAHSNNVAVTENSRPSWKSHSNTGIPHVSLDSQQLRFRAHKFGRRLCRSFSFGRRRGSYASRESAFDAAVLWLIQTPTDEEIAAVSGCSAKIEQNL